MDLTITHVFYKQRLIAEDSELNFHSEEKQLLLIDDDERENIYSSENVRSLEWCYHESGPLCASKVEAFIVLQFTSSQRIFVHQIDPCEPVVLVVGNPFADFLSLNVTVIKYQRVFTPDVVKLLPFTKFPHVVKRVLPQVARGLTTRLRQELKEKEEKEKLQSVHSDATECIELDDEDAPESVEPYYDIDGTRMQITSGGIASLADGEFMNDEAMNLAFSNVRKEFPFAYIFDTFATGTILKNFEKLSMDECLSMSEDDYNRHFRKMFLQKGSNYLPLDETFFSKKMLIFPVNHIQHWFLVVVVNPLLGDIANKLEREVESHKAAAYYVDSLMGTANYGHEIMLKRLGLTWRCIFSFLRLGALYHKSKLIDHRLIPCYYESTIPSQENNYDCGPHSIINARLMAGRFDELINGPKSVEISEEESEEVLKEVGNFRKMFRDKLASCKLPSS